MIALLLFAVLLKEKLEVPASRWKAIDVPAPAAGMLLEASFTADPAASRIAMILVTRDDALRFEGGRSIRPLSSTPWAHEGRLSYRFRDAGQYALLIDNRIEGRRPTPVTVQIELSDPRETTVRELSTQKKILVITASLLFFVAIVMYTARKFTR